MLDLNFKSPDEILTLLCERLRQQRLRRQFTQAELAQRAGTGVNTVSNLEAGRNISFEVVVRVAMVLGLSGELENLFLPQLESLDDLRHFEASVSRQRIRKKGHIA